MDLPSVSILTPVWNRRKFLPLMIENVKHMMYPKDKLEWVILDSCSWKGEPSEPLMSDAEVKKYQKELGVKIVYEYRKEALSIGKKRNILVKKASHNYCINLDSDDIYFPSYVMYNIKTLIDNKKQCSGSPQMIFIYPNCDYKITGIECKAIRQIHEGTMCYTKKHWKRMNGYASSSQGEGAGMVDGCNEKFFIKTDISKCMICVCHDDNTIDKKDFLKDELLVEGVEIDKIPHIKTLKDIFQPEPFASAKAAS